MNKVPRLSDPLVIVQSASPRLQMLLVNLTAADFRAVDLAIASPAERDSADLLLVDTLSAAGSASTPALQCVRAAFVRSGAPIRQEGYDFCVDSLSKLAWLRGQVMMRRRSALRESEFELRAETALDFGRSDVPPPLPSQQHVLIGAQPGPRWLAVTRALQANGVRVSACLTPETLAMRMVEETVSLVLVERDRAGGFINAAATTAAHDPRAEAVPIAVWPVPECEDSRGLGPQVDWTFAADESPNTVALKSRVLGRPGDVHGAGKAHSETHDSLTGLPSRLFFEHHLARQIEASRRSGLPISLATFRLHDTSRTLRIADLGGAIQKHLRAEDMAARLDWQTIAVSLRATDFHDAHAVADRLLRCLEHEGISPSSVRPRVTELRRGQKAEDFIQSAVGVKDGLERYKRAG